MTKNEKIWIDIHQICGDCGRRILETFDLENITLKDLLKVVKLYYEKGNMACKKCAEKE